MSYRTLIVLLVALYACTTSAQTDRVDCKQRPDHPNCAPRG